MQVDGLHIFLSIKPEEVVTKRIQQLLSKVKGLKEEGATHKLENFDRKDLDPLLNRIGDARYVLLGEVSHGTSEFYTWRAEITKRLIAEKDAYKNLTIT